MSAQLGRIASFLSVALLAGLIPAQEKARTVAELRKENAALRQQVKTLQAQRDAKKNAATRKDPENAELIQARAKLEVDRGNLEVAWALARSVLERGSIPPLALNPLAEIALRTGAAELAQSLNEKALALDPTDEQGQVLHAGILSGKGELGTAIRELETYRQTAEGSRSLVTLLVLAESYREQGESEPQSHGPARPLRD